MTEYERWKAEIERKRVKVWAKAWKSAFGSSRNRPETSAARAFSFALGGVGVSR